MFPTIEDIRKAGLTDREILVLSLVEYDGASFRDAAERMCIAHNAVYEMHRNATMKLSRVNINLPDRPKNKGGRPKVELMPTNTMDRKYTTGQRYNAVNGDNEIARNDSAQ